MQPVILEYFSAFSPPMHAKPGCVFVNVLIDLHIYFLFENDMNQSST